MPESRTPQYWRARAAEARELASTARHPNVRRVLLDIAANYDALAQIAETRDSPDGTAV